MTLGWPIAASISGRIYLPSGSAPTLLIGRPVRGRRRGAAAPRRRAAAASGRSPSPCFVIGLGFGFIASPAVVAAAVDGRLAAPRCGHRRQHVRPLGRQRRSASPSSAPSPTAWSGIALGSSADRTRARGGRCPRAGAARRLPRLGRAGHDAAGDRRLHAHASRSGSMIPGHDPDVRGGGPARVGARGPRGLRLAAARGHAVPVDPARAVAPHPGLLPRRPRPGVRRPGGPARPRGPEAHVRSRPGSQAGALSPTSGRARIVYAGVETDAEELRRMATGARAAVAKSGAEVDGQRFTPHLTLARINKPVEATGSCGSSMRTPDPAGPSRRSPSSRRTSARGRATGPPRGRRDLQPRPRW